MAPAAEQARICDEVEKQFTRLDASVASLQRVKANLKRYRASVLKAACEGRLVPTEAELARQEGRSFESGEELLKRILKERRARWEADQLAKMKAAGKVPRDGSWKGKYEEPASPELSAESSPGQSGWATATVEQCTTLVTKGTTPTSVGFPFRTEGVAFVKVENLRRGRIDRASIDCFIDEEAHTALKRSALEAGDVLISIAGTIGRLAVVRSEDVPANTNQAVAIARGSDMGLDSDFLLMALESTVVQTQARARMRGGAMNNISLGDVRGFSLPLPPLPEQQRIVSEVQRRLSVVDELEATVETNLARCARLRQSILKMAFAGRLVPQDPNDEPASVLLERIKSARPAGAIAATSPSARSPRGRRRARNP